ncbi:hypothetical protein LCGC14_2676110, partial [marine sediment metagenome]
MTDWGDGLYAKVADRIRDLFIPAHHGQDFDSLKVLRF